MSSASLAESLKAIEKAADAINAANYDLKGGFTLAAVNRTYYAIFYCMIGLLTLKDIHAKTHQGVQNKFGELFIKTNLFLFRLPNTYKQLLTCVNKPIMTLMPI